MTAATPGSAELLACPFCGADAAAKMYGRDMLFKVECNGCGAEMRGFDQCQQDAVDAWNARLAALPPDPDAMNEQRALEDAKLASNAREATIQECAKIARDETDTWIKGEATTAIGQAFQRACRQIDLKISALSTTGAPKP